jgi:hypothetical protein
MKSPSSTLWTLGNKKAAPGLLSPEAWLTPLALLLLRKLRELDFSPQTYVEDETVLAMFEIDDHSVTTDDDLFDEAEGANRSYEFRGTQLYLRPHQHSTVDLLLREFHCAHLRTSYSLILPQNTE